MIRTRLVAISGGPGSGKTTVLERFREHGYPVVAEAARHYTTGSDAKGHESSPPLVEFALERVKKDIAQYESVAGSGGITFFDRCLLDALCMLDRVGDLSREYRDELVGCYRFEPIVYLFPPWEAIYRMDHTRGQAFEEAENEHKTLQDWYMDCGYEVVSVPRTSVEERCGFILQSLNSPALRV